MSGIEDGGRRLDSRVAGLRERVHDQLEEPALLLGGDLPFRQPLVDLNLGDAEELELVVRARVIEESLVDSQTQGGASGDGVEEVGKSVQHIM